VLFVAGGVLSKVFSDQVHATTVAEKTSKKKAEDSEKQEKEPVRHELSSSFLITASSFSAIDLHADLFLVKNLSLLSFIPVSIPVEKQVDLLSYFENLFTHTICINAP